jgi:hypothetical protein
MGLDLAYTFLKTLLNNLEERYTASQSLMKEHPSFFIYLSKAPRKIMNKASD